MTLDTHWLSYSELADKLGITAESVRNLVRRRGWPRKPGNDGAQRIGVPVEYLDERTVSSDEAAIVATIIPPIEPPTEGNIEGTTMAALEAHIATLKTVVDHERHRADIERERADGERSRADALAAEITQLRADTSKKVMDALAADFAKLQNDEAQHVASVERSVSDLRAMVEKMQRADAPVGKPWWQGLAAALAGRA